DVLTSNHVGLSPLHAPTTRTGFGRPGPTRYKEGRQPAQPGAGDMEPIELRDLDAAKRYVAEGLWLQRAVRPSAATVRPALEWAMEIASAGHPLPPVGFVADVGHVAFGADAEHRAKEPPHVPGWPPHLGRQY